MRRAIRRLAATWAEALGAAGGVDAVEDFASCRWRTGEEPTAEELLQTIEPGQADWDEGAVNVGAAQIDGCPRGYEAAYYAAYERAARARVIEVAEWREVEAALLASINPAETPRPSAAVESAARDALSAAFIEQLRRDGVITTEEACRLAQEEGTVRS